MKRELVTLNTLKLPYCSKIFQKSKIILALRNPVERAISNYFSFNNGLETRSIDDVFINQKSIPVYNKNTSVSPFDYIKRGQYIDYIQNYFKSYSNNQILICFFEEFTTKLNYQKEILEFLGVIKDFPDFYSQKQMLVIKQH